MPRRILPYAPCPPPRRLIPFLHNLIKNKHALNNRPRTKNLYSLSTRKDFLKTATPPRLTRKKRYSIKTRLIFSSPHRRHMNTAG